MEFAWIERSTVMELKIASMEVMKRVANRCLQRKNNNNNNNSGFDIQVIICNTFNSNSTSDNKNETVACPPGYFMCDHNCLPLNKLCDGKVECYDYNDEADCNGTSNRYYQINYLFPYKRTMVKRFLS